MASKKMLPALWRGMRHRCPECGQGRLFRRYLKVQEICEHCGHENGRYPADDAPPYFTILIVGHLVIAPMLLFPFIWQAPAWLVLLVTLPTLLVLTLVILPIVKGAVIGGHWALGADHDRIGHFEL